MGTAKKKTRNRVRKFMQANKLVANTAAAKLGLSTLDGSNILPKPEDYRWETLKEEYESAARDVVQQLANCNAILERYKEPLNNALEVNAELIGLIKSYEDQATDLLETAARHRNGDVWRTGKIKKNDIDAEMEYLSILGKYMAIEENIARTTSLAMVSIMTTITADPRFKDDKIAKAAIDNLRELNDAIAGVHNEDPEAGEKLEGILNGTN